MLIGFAYALNHKASRRPLAWNEFSSILNFINSMVTLKIGTKDDVVFRGFSQNNSSV
jgi:hypothetical protein